MRASPLVLILLICATGSAASELPQPVQAAITAQKKACAPEKVTLKTGFVTKKDINGDGVDDFIIDYGAFQCGNSTSYFCGSAGCETQVFASSSGGYVKVLDENVQGLQFKRVKGRPAMLLGLHGTACGKRGADACGATLYWNGSKFSPAN